MQPTQTGQKFDWEYWRYISGRYLTPGRLDGESWQSVAFRISSYVTLFLPATFATIYFASVPKDPEPKVCLDFKKVLENWRKIEQGATPELNSTEEALACDMGRRGILFFDTEDQINQELVSIYHAHCLGKEVQFKNFSPEVRRYGTPANLRAFLLEATQGFLISKGFNKQEGALLALKAYYLLTPQSGACRLIPLMLRKAEKEGYLPSEQLETFAPSLNKLPERLYEIYEKFTWRNDSLVVEKGVPYLVVRMTNFCPNAGIWLGKEKTIFQKNYILATAKFNLLKDVDPPALNHIPQNELLFEIKIDQMSEAIASKFFNRVEAEKAISYVNTGDMRHFTPSQGCLYRFNPIF